MSGNITGEIRPFEAPPRVAPVKEKLAIYADIFKLHHRLEKEGMTWTHQLLNKLRSFEKHLPTCERYFFYLLQAKIIAEKIPRVQDQEVLRTSLQGVHLYLLQPGLAPKKSLIALEIAYILAIDNPEKTLDYARKGALLDPEAWGLRLEREEKREGVPDYVYHKEYAIRMKSFDWFITKGFSLNLLQRAWDEKDQSYLPLIDREILCAKDKISYHGVALSFCAFGSKEAKEHAGQIIVLINDADALSDQTKQIIILAYTNLLKYHLEAGEPGVCKMIFEDLRALMARRGSVLTNVNEHIVIDILMGFSSFLLGNECEALIHFLNVFSVAEGVNEGLQKQAAEVLLAHKEALLSYPAKAFIVYCEKQGDEKSLSFVKAYREHHESLFAKA